MRIPSTSLFVCAICGERLKTPLIVLPKLPLTELYVKEKPKRLTGFVDQAFFFCARCSHGQLGSIIDPHVLYTDHAYFLRTSQSGTAKGVNDTFADFILPRVTRKKPQTIIDIGASDLYLLRQLNQYADVLIGIDPMLASYHPTKADTKIQARGVFFEDASLLADIDPNTALVVSSHTLEHIPNPRAFLEQLFLWATEKTRFIFQFPSLEPLLADSRFDQIFHQHIHYFSLASFTALIEDIGADVLDRRVNFLHWGTLMVEFRKNGQRKRRKQNSIRLSPKDIQKRFHDFQAHMRRLRTYLFARAKEEKLYGYGAALMLPVLAYHLTSDLSFLDAIYDNDRQKNGWYYLNLPVPIALPPDDLSDKTILLTAVNTPRSIVPHIISCKPKRIILPFSTL